MRWALFKSDQSNTQKSLQRNKNKKQFRLIETRKMNTVKEMERIAAQLSFMRCLPAYNPLYTIDKKAEVNQPCKDKRG